MSEIITRDERGLHDTVSITAPIAEPLREPLPPVKTRVVVGNVMSIDGSGTIPAAGGAVLLFGGITPVVGYEICNVDDVQDLWISDTTTAAANGVGSIRISPGGGTYTTPRDYRPLGPVSAFSTKAGGHKVTARAW